MKKFMVFFVLVLLIGLSIPSLAQEAALPPNANKTLIEDNLFVGLAYPNIGLQRSCALMLGSLNSERAVIPLMEVLRNHTNENVRIAAAWALCKIGDPRGVYAVKMAVKYDDQSKVQVVCAWYYENFVKQGSFTFTQPEDRIVASAK